MNKKREETWLHSVTMTAEAAGYRFHGYDSARLDVTGRTLQEFKDA